MAVLSKQEFKDKWGGKFADNTIQDITEAVLRDFRQDIADTFADVAAVSAPTAPDYDPGAIYANGTVVLFGLPDKLFYQAKLPGLLPAPTPGVETAEWLPVARPLSPLLPYREMSAQQGRDFASDGLLEPAMLYRFTGRLDAQGAPLDDVLVAAVSRHSVAGADAYAIGIDPQTRQEYLLAVTYDLVTDTTSARSGGPGGPVDAYTKAQINNLLLLYASKQDVANIVGAAPAALDTLAEIANQLAADEVGAAAMLARIQQHTLQLNTLAVQASPVFGYLVSGGAPVGYASLDEALADPRPKTFMRFNQAVMPLATSNDPLNPGWASYVDGEGATLELGNNVVLSLPGGNVGTLLLKNFFVFQAAGTRGGRIKLLASSNTNTPPGQLPRLDGQYAVPLELSGGAYAFTGTYGSLLGTGTAHLFEPYDVAYVAPTVTVVEHKGGAGGGPGYSNAQIDAFIQTVDSKVDNLIATGGPVILHFPFLAGYTDVFDNAVWPTWVGTYNQVVTSNIRKFEIYRNNSITAPPLVLAEGDILRIGIERIDITLGAFLYLHP